MDVDKINSIDLTQDKAEKPNLLTDFNTYLETASAITRLGYNPNLPCKIHFFEWSDINKERMFTDDTEFIRFLTASKIYTKYWEDNRIKSLARSTNGVYVICKPGTTEVIIEDCMYQLKQALERAKALQAQSPHHVPAVVNQQGVGYGGYNAYGYGPNYGCYGDYDEYYD